MVAKILIVDDRPEVGRSMSRALRGYDTSLETDPRCAIRRVEDGEKFDVILCDLEMPEMTGKDVYDVVQRESVGAPPPMLMMSGGANVSSLFATGCPVLIKPFTNSELRSLVSAILRENADSGAGTVKQDSARCSKREARPKRFGPELLGD